MVTKCSTKGNTKKRWEAGIVEGNEKLIGKGRRGSARKKRDERVYGYKIKEDMVTKERIKGRSKKDGKQEL